MSTEEQTDAEKMIDDVIREAVENRNTSMEVLLADIAETLYDLPEYADNIMPVLAARGLRSAIMSFCR